MTISHRDVLLTGLQSEITRCLSGTDYGALPEIIWDTSSAMTSYEDKLFREFLQWFEGNLDMLLNLGAENETVNRFLRDQRALIETCRSDASTLKIAERHDAMYYLQG